MSDVTPLATAQEDELLGAFYKALRHRRPDLFVAGEPFRPGGVYEMCYWLPGLFQVARQRESNRSEVEDVEQYVCRDCMHRTSSGYCLPRNRHTCVLQQEPGTILQVVRQFCQIHQHSN